MSKRVTKKELPVHIVLVLDRSGSMDSVKSDVIGGVNSFIKEQKSNPGECRMTLVQFDSQDTFEVLADGVDIREVRELTTATYIPRGGTPLLDAEGQAIAHVRKGLKKDEKVIFATYTDGYENASREYTKETLTKAKESATNDGWVFIYLGAGHDAYGQAGAIGSSLRNTSSNTHTSKGHRAAAANYSGLVTSYRAAANAGNESVLAAATMDAYTALDVEKDES